MDRQVGQPILEPHSIPAPATWWMTWHLKSNNWMVDFMLHPKLKLGWFRGSSIVGNLHRVHMVSWIMWINNAINRPFWQGQRYVKIPHIFMVMTGGWSQPYKRCDKSSPKAKAKDQVVHQMLPAAKSFLHWCFWRVPQQFNRHQIQAPFHETSDCCSTLHQSQDQAGI